MTAKTVGLDLARDVFQFHGISETGRVIFNEAIKRAKLLSTGGEWRLDYVDRQSRCIT